jgi:subtilisin-like proprotein convertase family protein
MDPRTAWILADRLWFHGISTLGYDMYNCSLPNSDGCNGGSLYNVMMAIDDDGDGTANGTPHAAAIFSALDDHNIACGLASDPQNQNQSNCPVLTPTTVTLQPGSDSATVSWESVANATRYWIFRSDIDCDAGLLRVAEVTAPTTSYTDTTVVNGIEYYYQVQAVSDSDSCASAVSNCETVTPEPCAGSVRMARASYNCDDLIEISLVDSDLAGAGLQDVEVWSDSEPTPEIVTLVEDPVDSARFHGTIATSSSTAPGDGAVGVTHGDTITVLYHDASYCGPPQDVTTTAIADCIGPVISNVQTSDVTGFSAHVAWLTDEPADSLVTYDTALPPVANTVSSPVYLTSHGLDLMGLTECTEYYYSVSSADPAGNATTDTNAGAYYSFRTTRNTNPSYPSTDTPVPITDYSTATSVISVPDDKIVLDVDVTINITHTFDGDLEISLLGPDGTEVMLADRRGGSGENFIDTIFDDEAATPIGDGSPPFTGRFRPEEPLTAFDGLLGQGDWTLRVHDSAGGDQGSIDSWTLTLLFPGEVCPSSDGWVELDSDLYGCSSTMEITMQDVDLLGAGLWNVEIYSDTEPIPEVVELTEVPPNSGVFVGSFPTTSVAPSNEDDALSVGHDDNITVRYIDADDGQGGINVEKTDAANTDCMGPVISNVQLEATAGPVIVSFTTDEPGTTVVNYGTGLPPGETASDLELTTDHTLLLLGLDPCTRYWVSVESTDAHGNTSIDTSGGSFYSVVTMGWHTMFHETFDSDPGWEIDNGGNGNGWAFGQPTGGGGQYGEPDPTSGLTGPNVYGVNLAGDYDNNLGEDQLRLTTPSIDLSAANSAFLRYHRWLGIESPSYDHARVQLSVDGGPWTTLWENTERIDGGSWVEESFDLTAQAAGHSDVKIRWTLGSTDGSWQFCGWNLDDVMIEGAADCDPLAIFLDSFESGDTSAWSATFP